MTSWEGDEEMDQAGVFSNLAIDGAAGVAIVTAPWWMSLLEGAAHALMVTGALVLLGLRIAIAIRDLRARPPRS